MVTKARDPPKERKRARSHSSLSTISTFQWVCLWGIFPARRKTFEDRREVSAELGVQSTCPMTFFYSSVLPTDLRTQCFLVRVDSGQVWDGVLKHIILGGSLNKRTQHCDSFKKSGPCKEPTRCGVLALRASGQSHPWMSLLAFWKESLPGQKQVGNGRLRLKSVWAVFTR